MARLPLGIAQREVVRASREGFASEATFASLLLAMKLQTVPLPLPQLTTVAYLSLWPDDASLSRFRATRLARWQRARRHLSLTLNPIQSFGSWAGRDPLRGHRGDPDPSQPVLLITHSRTRPRSMPSFMLADRPVVRSLPQQPGFVWAGGFVDRPRSWDTGTLSLWRTAEDALRFAYRPGVHQQAVAAQREGGWFTESWFGRFEVRSATGSWPGIDLDGVRRVPPRSP